MVVTAGTSIASIFFLIMCSASCDEDRFDLSPTSRIASPGETVFGARLGGLGAYAFREDGSRTIADNPSQGYGVSLEAGGIVVTPDAPEANWEMRMR